MLQIKNILPDSVDIGSYAGNLYGLEVITRSEGSSSIFSPEEFEKLIKKGKIQSKDFMNKFLFIAINRSKVINNYGVNVYRTRYFIFSYAKEILQVIKEHYRDYAKEMTGEEITKALIDISTLLCYYSIDSDKKVRRYGIKIDSEDAYNLKSIRDINKSIKEAFKYVQRKHGYDIYVAYNHLSRNNVDLSSILESDWEGTLWIVIDLNDLSKIIKGRRVAFVREIDKFKLMGKFLEKYHGNDIVVAGVSLYLILKGGGEGSSSTASYIMTSLGFDSLPKGIDARIIVEETPLKRRDYDYLFFVDSAQLSRFFSSSLTKSTIPEEVDIYGISKQKEFVAYSFKEGNSPHSLIIAPTRSGKSFSVQKVVSQMLGFSVDELVNPSSDIAKKKSFDVMIRWFDIGFSASKFNNLLKLRGYDVEIASPIPEGFRYNIVEVNDIEDIEFSEKLINLVLKLKGESPLSAKEGEYFRKYMKIFLEDKSKIPSISNPIFVLKEVLNERDTFDELLRIGYDPTENTIFDIKEKKFNRLKQPLVSDVIAYANEDAYRADLPEEERAHIKGLVSKLSTVASIDYFNSYSNVETKTPEYVYYELSLLKDMDLFPAIASAIIWRVYKADIQRDRSKKKIYIFDEFHNYRAGYLGRELESMFDIMIRESARYNIRLKFISQNPEDFSDGFITNTGTKIFLVPSSGQDGEDTSGGDFIKAIKNVFGYTDTTIEKIKSLPKYHWFVVYAQGSFTFNMPVTEYEKGVFDSNISEYRLPNGEIITVN